MAKLTKKQKKLSKVEKKGIFLEEASALVKEVNMLSLMLL
jgi:hypothetical protein